MIEVGQTIGNYKITAKLGEGGMGVVYLAEHPVIGRKVAMKAIHPELSRNDEVVSRFITEAKSVNQIGHEHIVDISDFGKTPDGEFYFVMEYLQGEAMADRLKRVLKTPLPQALNITAQVADALGASHQHGIVHRDLKPENIYLVPRGANKDFVKVLDFGLAKLTQGEEKLSHKTRTGSVMGTPYYMSPEQCEGKISIDQRADIYSLGVILFEMLTGKVPFGGEGYGEIIVKHITTPPPSARSIAPELPPAIDLILYRALAKDRAHRFPSMAEFQAALLDPERYAASAPRLGIPADAPGAARAAGSMTRAERDRASEQFAAASGAASTFAGSVTSGPSTFRQGIGEVIGDEVPAQNPTRKWVLGIAAVAAIGAVAVGAFTFKGREPRRSAPVAALTPSKPAPPGSVRVTFGSDPTGATVVRADTGTVLGVTPLSSEVPYSDAAVEFVFKRPGFESKVIFVVPNVPSPLFATLPALPSKPVAAIGKAEAPAAAATPAAPKKPRKKPRVNHLDDDAVLEPTFK
jgi:tRNA A-37 threonylcarbamoyl transferase component Bud32